MNPDFKGHVFGGHFLSSQGLLPVTQSLRQPWEGYVPRVVGRTQAWVLQLQGPRSAPAVQTTSIYSF